VNIDWVIPCRYAEVHDNLGTIVGAGIDTFWVQELPSPIQVVLAVRLLAMAEELGPDQKHTATSRVRDPQGEPVSEVSGEFAIEVEAARPEWLAGFIVPGVVQFEATEEGTYMIEQEIDDASDSLPIHIVRGRPPGGEESDEPGA
jgi:hypothetical protein